MPNSTQSLTDLTTLRLGGPIGSLVTATTREELIAAAQQERVLLIGGGSNLVASDAGWPDTVLLVRTRGIEVRPEGGSVLVRASAGEVWDDFVKLSVESGWSGLAALSGIPGLVGATPVQNVGAYGCEVADVITALSVLDRQSGDVQVWPADRCGFGFRTSAVKHTDRYVVLDVTFRLGRSTLAPPVRYLELARRLEIEQFAVAESARVRSAVLALRASKGMVLDPHDHDTWSVGSFFVNPVVSPSQVPPDAPHWEVDGQVKLSAAWLIENTGFTRGYGLPGPVSVSTKHTLALTNRGGATTAQLLTLAREIQAGVAQRFGVVLHPEARLANCAL